MQAAKLPPSSLHSKVASGSLPEWKVKVAPRSRSCRSGPLSTSAVGTGGVSATFAAVPIAPPFTVPVMCAVPCVPVAVSVAE